MSDKDIMAGNKKQLTCEGNTNHIRGNTSGISYPKTEKNRHTRGHRDGLKTKYNKTKIGPILKPGRRHQQVT